MTITELTREEAMEMALAIYPSVDFSNFTEEEFGLMEDEMADFINMSQEEYDAYYASLFDYDC